MVHTRATGDDPYAGIIMFVSKTFDILQKTDLIEGRLVNVKIRHQVNKKVYNITPLYGYSSKKESIQKIKLFTEQLNKVHTKEDQNYILGDFNFVDNDLDRTSKNKTGMNQSDKILSTPWMEFINKIDMSDPFRESNKNRKMFSYIHTQNKAKSRIDRIYTNNENTHNIIHYKHTPTPFTQTHRIISFTIKEENERGPGYWKMNISIIKDPPFQKIIEKTYKDVHDLNIIDPIERWQVFIETVRIEAMHYSSKKRSYQKRIKSVCENT